MVLNLACTPWGWHGYSETCWSKLTIESHILSAFSWYLNENSNWSDYLHDNNWRDEVMGINMHDLVILQWSGLIKSLCWLHQNAGWRCSYSLLFNMDQPVSVCLLCFCQIKILTEWSHLKLVVIFIFGHGSRLEFVAWLTL